MLTPEGNRSRTRSFALWIAGGLYLVLCVRLVYGAWSATEHLTFPLDDTYITMAMAKNLALHGTWGITAARFGPASSCPGFLLLLAGAYFISGPSIWWPLVLSIGFGVLALAAGSQVLRDAGVLTRLLALASLVVLTPLDVLGVLGMEHTLHIALVLLFLDASSQILAEGRSPSLFVLALTALMVSVRYESLFVVTIAALLLLERRNIRSALRLLTAAATPVTVYAVFAATSGAYWLPHSIAIKGTSVGTLAQAPAELAQHFYFGLSRAPHLAALLVVMAALLSDARVRADIRARSLLCMVLGATFIHLALAGVGWVYRYEGYLVAASVAAIAIALRHVKTSPDRWTAEVVFASGAVAIFSLLARTAVAEVTVPQRFVAVYAQQVQMAKFLERFENTAVVAANDVGAINYYTDIDCLDLVGLGDRDVFWLKRTGTYTTANLAHLAAARGVQFAVVYDSWFSGAAGPALPGSWIRVSRWRTSYGHYLGDDTVSFYATTPGWAAKLREDLTLFAPSLPSLVTVLDPPAGTPPPER